jgi:hypothetical protein
MSRLVPAAFGLVWILLGAACGGVEPAASVSGVDSTDQLTPNSGVVAPDGTDPQGPADPRHAPAPPCGPDKSTQAPVNGASSTDAPAKGGKQEDPEPCPWNPPTKHNSSNDT